MQAAPPMQPAPRGELRQLLLQRFDRNHDGRLEPRERRQAARALHRLANRLVQMDARAMRNGMSAPQTDARERRQRKFIRRFDIDHDGNVGPNEMPPGLADQMRPLDRDGDGWLRDDELP
jgi:Ca2+-binding EF-hand superfamily protein